MSTRTPAADNTHRMSGKSTWRSEGYDAGLVAYDRLLQPNPTDYHEYYVKGWRQAWAHRDDAAPALERVLDDRARWSRTGGWVYNHEGRRLGDPDNDSIRVRVTDGIAVHLHPGMTLDTVERELIEARRAHAAIR